MSRAIFSHIETWKLNSMKKFRNRSSYLPQTIHRYWGFTSIDHSHRVMTFQDAPPIIVKLFKLYLKQNFRFGNYLSANHKISLNCLKFTILISWPIQHAQDALSPLPSQGVSGIEHPPPSWSTPLWAGSPCDWRGTWHERCGTGARRIRRPATA